MRDRCLHHIVCGPICQSLTFSLSTPHLPLNTLLYSELKVCEPHFPGSLVYHLSVRVCQSETMAEAKGWKKKKKTPISASDSAATAISCRWLLSWQQRWVLLQCSGLGWGNNLRELQAWLMQLLFNTSTLKWQVSPTALQKMELHRRHPRTLAGSYIWVSLLFFLPLTGPPFPSCSSSLLHKLITNSLYLISSV